MKGLIPLLLGFFGTFAFSWMGLTMVPNLQIGHLDPQMDEEGADVYPAPKSGMAERGRQVYAANGCHYCHSQWLRPFYAASDIDRKWGDRRSAPRDYIFDRPVFLGKTRLGPDLANVGKRAPAEPESAASPAGSPGASPTVGGGTASASPVAAASPAQKPAAVASPAPAAASASSTQTPVAAASPAPSPTTAKPGEPPLYSAAWHHQHLYSPRSIILDSNMPAYRFLYEKRRIQGEPSADGLKLKSSDAPPHGWEIVPSYEANCLVAYLMSLDQSHPLKEVKSAATASAPAAAPSPATSPSPAAAAPPK